MLVYEVNLAEQEVNMVKIDVIERQVFMKFNDPHKVEGIRMEPSLTIIQMVKYSV
jgi:hypothetical protein